jgi:hypothetical protein
MGTSHFRRHKHSTPDLQFYPNFDCSFHVKSTNRQYHTKCKYYYHRHRTNFLGESVHTSDGDKEGSVEGLEDAILLGVRLGTGEEV